MRSVARNWIIQRKIGLISQDEIVTLADDYIANHDEFPSWMIDISTNGSLERERQLDIVMEPITEDDCKLIAQQMIDRFSSGDICLHKLASACNNIYLLLEWGSAAFDQFIWISDEVAIIDQGYKSEENIKINIKEALCRVIAL